MADFPDIQDIQDFEFDFGGNTQPTIDASGQAAHGTQEHISVDNQVIHLQDDQQQQNQMEQSHVMTSNNGEGQIIEITMNDPSQHYGAEQTVEQDVEIVTEGPVHSDMTTGSMDNMVIDQSQVSMDNIMYGDIASEISITEAPAQQYVTIQQERPKQNQPQTIQIQAVPQQQIIQQGQQGRVVTIPVQSSAGQTVTLSSGTGGAQYYTISGNQLVHASPAMQTVTTVRQDDTGSAKKYQRVQMSDGTIRLIAQPQVTPRSQVVTIGANQLTLSPNTRTIQPKAVQGISQGNVIYLSNASSMSSPRLVQTATKIAPKSPQRSIAPAPVRNQAGQQVQIVKLVGGSGGSKTSSPMKSIVSANRVIQGQRIIQLPTGAKAAGGNVIQSNSGLIFLQSNQVVGGKSLAKSVISSPGSSQRANFVPIAPSPVTPSKSNSAANALQISLSHALNASLRNSSSSSPSKTDDPSRPRKPCNCTKSACLKLYCDCFANGEFCNNCNCNNCANNLEKEEERQRAIKQCLERNPEAFRPKIGKSRLSAGEGNLVERRHTKGCNCRRSGCLKNYCECYEAKILCSGICKCAGCKNFEDSFERKTLMHLADAAEVRSAQQFSVSKSRWLGADFKPKLPVAHYSNSNGSEAQWLTCSYFTQEVMDSTAQCLLAQAENAQITCKADPAAAQRLVLEEFGRCLSNMIDCADRKTLRP